MKILNVPNILTMLRMVMIPLFIYVFFLPNRYSMVWAAIIYIAAAVTDFLDGMIARKYNLITNFGKLFDPLADKLLQLSAVACLVIADILPIWFFIFYIAKEAIQIVASIFLLKSGVVVSSNIFGKVASVLFYAATVAFLIFEIDAVYKNFILIVVVLMSLLAFIKYGMEFMSQKKALSQNKEDNI